jgi:hypothetical protein
MSETVEEYKQRVARSGGFGRAAALSKKQLKESARKAAQARWSKRKKSEAKV